nr:unnamed protein product [Digitaria exilis]
MEEEAPAAIVDLQEEKKNKEAAALARLVDDAARGAPDADVPFRVPLLLLLLLGARRRRGDDGHGGAEADRPEHVEVVSGHQHRRGLGDVVVVVGGVEEVVGVEQVDGIVGEQRGEVDVGVVGERGEGGFVGGLVELWSLNQAVVLTSSHHSGE